MNDTRRALVRIPIFGALVVGAVTLLHLIGLQPWGAWGAGIASVMGSILFVASLFFGVVALLPALLLALLAKRWRRGILLVLYLYGVFAVLGLGAWRLTFWCDDHAYRGFATRMDPLVAAIERYEREHGRPPRDLSQLVPGYIASIPETRIGLLGSLRYEGSDPDSTITRRAYYLLGPGEPVVQDFGARGPEDKAVLWLEFESHGRVLNATLIRYPKDSLAAPFDSVTWRAHPAQRTRMAQPVNDWLVSQHPFLPEVLRRLGPPDEAWDSGIPRWSLSAEIAGSLLEANTLGCTPDGRAPRGYLTKRGLHYGRWQMYSDASD